MQFKLGDRFARCPYCGGTEFVAPEGPATPSRELACAQCGGFASRKLVLEHLRDEAIDRLGKPRNSKR